MSISDMTDLNKCLHNAITDLNFDKIKYLIGIGANTEKRTCMYECPIIRAILKMNIKLLETLITCGVQLETRYSEDTNITPLVLCMDRTVSINFAKVLISNGANVHQCSRYGDLISTLMTYNSIGWNTWSGYEEISIITMLIMAGHKVSLSHMASLNLLSEERSKITLKYFKTTPLTLLQICRIVIRNKLVKISRHTSITIHIQKLPLPCKFKFYLTLGHE